MKRLHAILLTMWCVGVAAPIVPGCGSAGGSSGEACGGHSEVLSAASDWLKQDPSRAFVDSNQRKHVFWTVSQDGICPANHVTASFRVDTMKEADQGFRSTDVQATAKVYWGGFYEIRTTLQRSLTSSGQIEYTGVISDIGLRQAFGADPGSLNMEIEVSYPRIAMADEGPKFIDIVQIGLSYDTYVTAPSN